MGEREREREGERGRGGEREREREREVGRRALEHRKKTDLTEER